MKTRLTTLLATVLLALQLAQATNPPTPPGGKNNGDNNSGSDSSESPSSGSSGSGSGGSSGSGNGSGTGGGKKDCDGTGSAGDGNSNNNGGCNEGPCDPVNPPPPSCIKDTVPLAFAPNDDGLGAGILQLYIEGTSENLGSRNFIEFFGLPYMVVTKAQDLGGRTSYETIQAGGSRITFEINDAQAAPGWIVGQPVGGEAYSQARITFVTSAGLPSQLRLACPLKKPVRLSSVSFARVQVMWRIRSMAVVQFASSPMRAASTAFHLLALRSFGSVRMALWRSMPPSAMEWCAR